MDKKKCINIEFTHHVNQIKFLIYGAKHFGNDVPQLSY